MFHKVSKAKRGVERMEIRRVRRRRWIRHEHWKLWIIKASSVGYSKHEKMSLQKVWWSTIEHVWWGMMEWRRVVVTFLIYGRHDDRIPCDHHYGVTHASVTASQPLRNVHTGQNDVAHCARKCTRACTSRLTFFFFFVFFRFDLQLILCKMKRKKLKKNWIDCRIESACFAIHFFFANRKRWKK